MTPRRITAATLALLTALAFGTPAALADGPRRGHGVLPGEPRVRVQVHHPRHRGHRSHRVLHGFGLFFDAVALAAELAAQAEAEAAAREALEAEELYYDAEELYSPPEPGYDEPIYEPPPVYRPAPTRRGPPPTWIPEGANQGRYRGPHALAPQPAEDAYDDDAFYDDDGYAPPEPGGAPEGYAAPEPGDAPEGYAPPEPAPAPANPAAPSAAELLDDDAFDDLEDETRAFFGDDETPGDPYLAPAKRPLAALVPADSAATAPPTTEPAPQTAPAAPATLSKDRLGAKARATLAAEILRLVNVEREAQGAAPLQPNAAMAVAAAAHSEEMARLGYFAHESPNPTHPRFTHRLQEAGVTRYGIASENIAKSVPRPSAAKDLLALWLTSPPHRAALLDPTYQLTGIGVWSDGQHLYATQLFADYVEQR
jgi:uncharacterized protein YkwD